jgi:peptidoglycan-N-acetylglucosamine deacetylase
LSELWWVLPRIGHAGDGRAAGVLSIWIWWDRFLQRRWQLRKVRPDGIFRYRLARYRGPTIRLHDGTLVGRNDVLLELHFDNPELLTASRNPGWSPWGVMEGISLDLVELAKLVQAGSLGPVKALHGTTLFAVPGQRLGFELHRVPHTIGWALERYFLIGLLPIYHRDGWKEFDRMRRNRWPAELWMSTGTLRQRYESPPT